MNIERMQKGGGVHRDFMKAFKWFKAAAEQGHAGAQYELAEMYEHGLGVPKDSEEGHQMVRSRRRTGAYRCQTGTGKDKTVRACHLYPQRALTSPLEWT